MNILFYYWGEWSANDCMAGLTALGHHVTKLSKQLSNYDTDEQFETALEDVLKSAHYDCVFSFNYFPILSRVCQQNDCLYLSWIYDSPNATLYSTTLSNSCNRVFLFDGRFADMLQKQGFDHIYHCPLAVNTKRLNPMTFTYARMPFEHEISFVGSLYTDSYNHYDQIHSLPLSLKGYLDGAIASACQVFGSDLLQALMTPQKLEECLSHLHFETSNLYRPHEADSLLQILKRKMTAMERTSLLSTLSDLFFVDLYTASPSSNLTHVRNLGYADYITEMPRVFTLSKINLNITLRTILSGIPLRALDILGCGGFLLSDYKEELSEYFTDGKELILYYSPEDLVEKAAFYLKHDTLRSEIAANGFEKINLAFRYEDQLQKILKLAF